MKEKNGWGGREEVMGKEIIWKRRKNGDRNALRKERIGKWIFGKRRNEKGDGLGE